MNTNLIPSTVERVARSTPHAINERIRQEMEDRLLQLAHAGPDAIERRLQELDREWDVERTLEANAASVALTGVILAATVDRRFLLLPGLVATFLLQHAIQGWCPPLPLFRALGVRTASEIEQERYALKALRGDFRGVTSTAVVSEPSALGMADVGRALNAVK